MVVVVAVVPKGVVWAAAAAAAAAAGAWAWAGAGAATVAARVLTCAPAVAVEDSRVSRYCSICCSAGSTALIVLLGDR